ncbi:MAG: ShlB/FhaC/HecB family hemolysin secretion/activation protein, partial [Selenomonas massiliensis]
VRQELGGRWHLNVRTQMQAAGDNLDSSEEIYLGGASGVRAYPQGEASGDNGCLGSIELSYRTDVPNLVLSTYFDLGHVQYANDGKNGSETLKGWGIGVSYSRPGDYFMRLDWARRVGLPEGASEAAKAKNRLWFMLGKVW